jgi:hypothetical protein
MERKTLERREFLKKLGMVALSIQVISLSPFSLAQAQEEQQPTENDLVIRSGPSRFAPLPGHFHNLIIPLTLFQSPPLEGVKLVTTRAYGHRHVVKLSQEQLAAVAQGSRLEVTDTVTDHKYVIMLT